MKRFLALASMCILSVVVSAAAPKTYQFSADMVLKNKGRTSTVKVYVNNDRSRIEMGAPGHVVIGISRRDKKTAWSLMTDQKKYIEMPLNDEGQLSLFDPSVDIKYALLVGADAVDGHPCKKYHYTAILNGKAVSGTSWQAVDLKDLPIQWSNEAGDNFTTLKNIKLGPSPDSLFEIPAGYTKTDLGSLRK